ncbi:hypothetical protein GGX14DRAFT_701590 [Mycena pura]|uniref:Uncharacterized protein n=1 Tax=Mycena pura TaxID=153505 RepID=A0AAD6UNX4_9AGAR|nr:hypothetical protein GGX14DRAFT_701590 [Mycena pura]
MPACGTQHPTPALRHLEPFAYRHSAPATHLHATGQPPPSSHAPCPHDRRRPPLHVQVGHRPSRSYHHPPCPSRQPAPSSSSPAPPPPHAHAQLAARFYVGPPHWKSATSKTPRAPPTGHPAAADIAFHIFVVPISLLLPAADLRSVASLCQTGFIPLPISSLPCLSVPRHPSSATDSARRIEVLCHMDRKPELEDIRKVTCPEDRPLEVASNLALGRFWYLPGWDLQDSSNRSPCRQFLLLLPALFRRPHAALDHVDVAVALSVAHGQDDGAVF